MSEEIKIVYKKICANPKCKHGFDFTSTSRNQKYCCDECADIMRGKKRVQAKKRATKRKEYKENQDVNKMLNRAYGLSHYIADEVFKISQNCACCGAEQKKAEGQLVNELHHKNLVPMDTNPANMVYLCKSCHKAVHDRTVDINIVTTYNEAMETEDPVAYFKDKLSGVEDFDTVIADVRKAKGLEN